MSKKARIGLLLFLLVYIDLSHGYLTWHPLITILAEIIVIVSGALFVFGDDR